MDGSMIPQMYYSVAKTMTTLPTMTCHNDRRSVIGGIKHSVICSNRLLLVVLRLSWGSGQKKKL